MIDKIFIFLRKAFSKVEIDRIYTKLDRVDERIDRIEVIQEAQNGKLNSIHEISLANLEAVEQKINRIGAQVADGYESAKEVTGVKFDAMQKSFEHLERLVLEVLKNR